MKPKELEGLKGDALNEAQALWMANNEDHVRTGMNEMRNYTQGQVRDLMTCIFREALVSNNQPNEDANAEAAAANKEPQAANDEAADANNEAEAEDKEDNDADSADTDSADSDKQDANNGDAAKDKGAPTAEVLVVPTADDIYKCITRDK